jgi:hypothetical protein
MLHPLLASCCPRSHEILLNQGMKYWDSGLHAPSLRTFITAVHIAAAVIGWRRSGNERTGQTQFSTKFAAKLSFILPWSSLYFFSLFFEISSPMWPNRGFRCRLFLTLRIILSNTVHIQSLVGPLFDGLKPKKLSNYNRIVCKRRVFLDIQTFGEAKKMVECEKPHSPSAL